MAYFIFAEFGNEFVVNFLTELRQALQCQIDPSPIHVTLRGPYKKPPALAHLEEYAQRLRGLGVAIGKHGYFYTPKGFAVFVLAECSVFRALWDKPDFKVSREHIQPHITLFESPDREAAKQVHDFLRVQNMRIHTYNIRLSIYESRAAQGDLFSRPTAFPVGRPISRDVYRIQEGMLEKAYELGRCLAERVRARSGQCVDE